MTEYNQAQIDLLNKLLGLHNGCTLPGEYWRALLKNERAYIENKERKE